MMNNFTTISDDWKPTASAINALPAPLRKYIHDVEAMCDPAGMVQQIAALRDQVDQLCAWLRKNVPEPQHPDARLVSLNAQLRVDLRAAENRIEKLIEGAM